MARGGKGDNTFPRYFPEIRRMIQSTEHLKRVCEEKGFVSGHVENESLKSRSTKPREGYERWRIDRRSGRWIRIT